MNKQLKREKLGVYQRLNHSTVDRTGNERASLINALRADANVKLKLMMIVLSY